MDSNFPSMEPALALPTGYDPSDHPFEFDGQAGPLFKLYLKNVVLTLLTLGIYRFWAKVEVKQFIYQHTAFHGGRFGYHATGLEKFIGFLKGLCFIVPLVLIVVVLYNGLRQSMSDETAWIICFYAFFGILGLLRPLIVVGSRSFNLSRTSWNNLRFRFNGRIGKLYGLYFKDFLFLILTLGIYTAWHHINVRRFTTQHSLFGDQTFDYDGRGEDLFGLYLLGGILSYITLGIYIPWYIAKLHRFHINHTQFQGQSFESKLTGSQMFGFILMAFAAVILTVGLAFPWVIIRYRQMIVNTTYYIGSIDLDAIEASNENGSNATIEGIGEAGEALGSIGEFFGG